MFTAASQAAFLLPRTEGIVAVTPIRERVHKTGVLWRRRAAARLGRRVENRLHALGATSSDAALLDTFAVEVVALTRIWPRVHETPVLRRRRTLARLL